MQRHEHLLSTLAEECCEVAQRATKSLRFGLTEVQPGQDLDNATRIMHEMADLFAVYEMAGLPPIDRELVEAKREKVEKYLRYSESMGTLSTKSRTLAARVKELEDVVNEKDRIMAKTWELVTSSLEDCKLSSDPEPGQTLLHIFSEMVIDRRPLTEEERERAYWQMMEGGVFDELKKARNTLAEGQSGEEV